MKIYKFLALIAICVLTSFVGIAQQRQGQGQGGPGQGQGQAAPSSLLTSIKADLDRVYGLINANTPTRLLDRPMPNPNAQPQPNAETPNPVTDFRRIDANTSLERGRFGIITYEWGVTYSAMLRAAEIFGDRRYADYVFERFNFIGDIYPHFVRVHNEAGRSALRGIIAPIWLDDCGSMQAAFVKGVLANPSLASKLRPIIDLTFDFTMYKEHRLPDRTLARMRPAANSLWVDDMYMGIPTIAYMAKLIERENPELAQQYYTEAALQIELFRKYLWMPDKQLFKHSWVESMTYHPPMYWGRANGWALLAMSDVLDVLPADHRMRPAVMNSLKELLHGMMSYQGGDGFLHQVLDRFDSYTETSVTAMFAYVAAHAVNEGWGDAQSYGPAAVAAWRAVATRINEMGEVEGTCVATGVSYEPGFYYRRPTNVNAPHGYGPVILAGSEVMKMVRNAPRFYDGGATLLR